MLSADARERARARAWTPTRERAELLGAVCELFTCQELTREQAIQEATSVAAEILGDAVVVYLLDADRRLMTATGADAAEASTRPTVRGMVGRRFSAEEAFTAVALDTGETMLVPHVTPPEIAALQPGLAEICSAIGMTGFVVAPMPVRGGHIGLVAQGRTRAEPPLGEDDRRFLEELALHVSLGVAGWSQAPCRGLGRPLDTS